MSQEGPGVLVQKLHKRTLVGKVAWEETAQQGVYQAVFGDFILQISSEPSEDEPDIRITILNAMGNKIDSFTDVTVKDQMPHDLNAYHLMTEIYEAARRVALGTDQAIRSIISTLDEGTN